MEHYLYALRFEDAVKVGVTWEPRKRLTTLRTAHPYPEKLKYDFIVRISSYSNRSAQERARELESKLHSRLYVNWLNGEWFKLGSTELESIIRTELTDLKWNYEIDIAPIFKAPRVNDKVKWARSINKLKTKMNQLGR